jgi:DNA-binding response OmpR family regulator
MSTADADAALSPSARILVVDDDPTVSDVVGRYLRRAGYDVTLVDDGIAAVEWAEQHAPDLVVLDIMLPSLDGLAVCRRLRQRGFVPVILLTALGAETDRIMGLEVGADDYVTKPFSPEELLARIRVAIRRVFSEEEGEAGQIRCGDLTIDYDRRRVLRADEEIRLSPKEFDLLSLLAHNPDRVLTHRTILKAVWGPNAVDQPEHLWVLMGQLRKKIEVDPANPRYLISEPWVGYRLATGSPD